MGKLLQFRPRLAIKPVPRNTAPPDQSAKGVGLGIAACTLCGHKLNVHISHPNGLISCAARDCRCETRPRRI